MPQEFVAGFECEPPSACGLTELQSQVSHFPVNPTPHGDPCPSASPGRLPEVKKEARATLLLHERVIFAPGDT